MKKLDPLSYLKLNKWQRFQYKLECFFCSVPAFFTNLGMKIWFAIKGFGLKIANIFKNIYFTFKEGDVFTRISFFIISFPTS